MSTEPAVPPAASGSGGRPVTGSARPDSGPEVTLLLFAAAREAAGTGRQEMRGRTVGDVLGVATERFGQAFAAVLAASRVWVDGQPATSEQLLSGGEEVAVLPPVSGGAG